MHYLVGTPELIGMKKTLESVKGLLISYLMIKKETNKDIFQESKIPDVTQHFGSSYVENLASVETDLKDLSLNELYTQKALEVFMSKNTES